MLDDQELNNVIRRCKDLSEKGTFSWWTDVAEALQELQSLRSEFDPNPYLWVIEHPAFYDHYSGGEPETTEIIGEWKPGAAPLYKGKIRHE